jgi:hypothetical protein
VLDLAAGEGLSDHEVHERAWPVDGEIQPPWPGSGHPGAITIREKLYARRHAAKRANA